MIEKHVQEACDFISKKTKLRPKIGLVLGSGLSNFSAHLKIECQIPFHQIPHFAVSSVDGHPGQLLIGHIDRQVVAVLAGRLHAYEGLTMEQVVHPIRTLAKFGVHTLLLTNAAGGLSKKMRPGDFVVLKDQINFSGQNPLRGPNYSAGPRFVDMTEPFDPLLRRALKAALKAEKIRHTEGVYVGVMGPTYETASEVKMLARLGGAAVGMSTVPEVIAARHLEMRVAGLSCITNLGTGLASTKLSHGEVKAVAQQVEKQFARAVVRFVKSLKVDN